MSVVAVSGLAGISPLSPYSDRPLTDTSPNERMRNGDWSPTQVLVASLAQSKWRIKHRFPKHRSDRGRIPANRHEYSVPRPLTPTNHGPNNIWRVCGYAGDPQKPLPSYHRVQGGPRSVTQSQTAASGPKARTGRFAGISPLNTPSTSKATKCSKGRR